MRLLAVALLLVILARSPSDAEPMRPVQVMVLGTWHFENPGQDLNNVRSDDVLTERRQRELRALSCALARFRPTKIMIERVAGSSDLLDRGFQRFTAEQLRTSRGEEVQIGYRLAQRLGHSQVFAIDEQASQGEPDYFPFGAVSAYARQNGLSERLQQMLGTAAAETAAIEERQARMTIPQLLIGLNDPALFASSIGGYYQLLRFGDHERQPGADLNAMWYLRNAKIFGKLMTVAQPQDRILVVFGAGHNYWLRHFARETPGYQNVDVLPFLRQARSNRTCP